MTWPNFGLSNTYTIAQIQKIERHIHGVWIGNFALKTQKDLWSEYPVSLFYVENPDLTKNHKHLVGLYKNHLGESIICDGSGLNNIEFSAVECAEGEILISTFRHHYNTGALPINHDMFIDGGFDYSRTSSPEKLFRYKADFKMLTHHAKTGPKKYRYTALRFAPRRLQKPQNLPVTPSQKTH